MKKQFKKGQKGKVCERILISVEEYELEGGKGIITADETFVEEGNFTVVKDHGDCLEVIFDDDPNQTSCQQVGRNYKGELINWFISDDDFRNIEVNGKRCEKVKIVEKGFKLCSDCGSVMSKVCMCKI